MASSFRSRLQLRERAFRSASWLGVPGMARRAESWLASVGRPTVRILSYHATTESTREGFRAQIAWLQRHFHVLRPDEYLAQLALPTLDRPAVVISFDDGQRCTFDVAAPVLEEAGIRAFFFVNPGFALLRGDEARRFYTERTTRGSIPEPMPAEFFTPMSPDDLRALHARGHTIGSHTMTHAALSELTPAEFPREIAASGALLAEWLGTATTTFAWTFGWQYVRADALAFARRVYPHCFSPCVGTMHLPVRGRPLHWRTPLRADMPLDEFASLASGIVDLRWTGARRWLSRLWAEAAHLEGATG